MAYDPQSDPYMQDFQGLSSLQAAPSFGPSQGIGSEAAGPGGLAASALGGMAAANPYLAGAGVVMDVAETGLNIWQGLEAKKQAEKHYRAQMARYQQQLRERAEERRRREEADRIAKLYAGYNLGQDFESDLNQKYASDFSAGRI